MKTIAIDTSLARGFVACGHDGRVALRWLDPPGAHARLLVSAIEHVTAELGWRPAEADLVAVVRGPGSFTGLRVGVTSAKALAWASGARLLGVSGCTLVAGSTAAALSLELDTLAAPPIHVAYDAGRGEVFATVATRSPAAPYSWHAEPGVLVPAAAWIADLPPAAIVSGPAVPALTDALRRRPDLVVAPHDAHAPAATTFVAVAEALAAAGRADDPATLLPEYMRPSYAHESSGG